EREPPPGGERRPPATGRRLDRLAEEHLSPCELARLRECLGEIGNDLDPCRVAFFAQVVRAPEQVRRRRHVLARERAGSGRTELVGGPPGELALAVVRLFELGEIRVRLLEVEAEDLLILDAAS